MISCQGRFDPLSKQARLPPAIGPADGNPDGRCLYGPHNGEPRLIDNQGVVFLQEVVPAVVFICKPEHPGKTRHTAPGGPDRKPDGLIFLYLPYLIIRGELIPPGQRHIQADDAYVDGALLHGCRMQECASFEKRQIRKIVPVTNSNCDNCTGRDIIKLYLYLLIGPWLGIIMDEEKKAYLYESIADNIFRMIASGTFRSGDRIPSIRALSRQMGVSITTAMGAYRLLEIRDVIEARPQSGYYVLPPARNRLGKTSGSTASIHRDHDNLDQRSPEIIAQHMMDISPTHVSLDRLVSMILKDAMNPDLVQLGATIPNPDLLPLKKLNRDLASAVRMRGIQSVSYNFFGLEALRVQIAKRATVAGCTLTPEDIVITSGCQEAGFLALQTVCKAGDTVVIESPAYFIHLQAMEMLGLKVVEIPSHPQHGIYLDTLRYVLEETPVKACLLVSNFSNPLGSCMPDEKKKELANMLAERDIPLIEDDIYGDICFSSHRPRVVKAFDEKGLVILCSSFSKTLAPGFRVGWTAPGRFKAQIEYQKMVCNLATATPPQMAVAEFLASGGYDHYLRRIRRIYARYTFLMSRAVAEHFPEGTRISRPSGGFFLWVELPGHIDSILLYEKALQAGITIAPGPIFSARQKFRNCIRLNTAIWSERTEKAIRKLGELVQCMA